MKFTFAWLKEHLDTDRPLGEIADRLTMIGLEVERIAALKYGMADLRDFFAADVRWLNHYGFRPLDFPTLAGGLSA